MKVVVKTKHGEGFVELMDIEKPSAGVGEVIIEVKAAGTCGSDIHFYHGRYKHLLSPPVVLGHEFSDIITEVGENVKGIKLGERAVADSAAYVCGECYLLQNGKIQFMPRKGRS